MSDLEGYRRAAPRARLGIGAAIVLVLVALAVTVGIGIWRGQSAPVEHVTAPPQATEPATAVASDAYVHVSGAVRAPGLYVVGADARVIDAVSAAGGLADDADASAINLARPVTDGEQLVVPVEGEAPPAGPSAGSGSAPGLVSVNTADAAALEELPGIGPALAARIIDWRDTEGPFATVDDLLAVSGIGPKVLESLRDLVTV
ncbi:MAG TPA: ComEA family DNA-binding protein [Candidatus Microbacterium stercoravium]|uniref:ComEA family DNA-binding protein n=1 Tax=Candidatus Microbacterium stercoravium TaxID=2838697 RepID=A0A9D2H6D6_9MICO|nr:ComEA family DNA-binding protein [Candidatus Microbacterium stercoravium]